MPEPLPGTLPPAAPVPAATPAPATPGAGAPATPQVPPAAPGVAPVNPPAGMVPISALHDERTKRQELAAEVERLRAQVSAPPQMQLPQQQQNISQVDPKVELERLWDTDPRKAVQVEIMYAMDWRDRVDASLNQQADQMATKFSDFNNYRSAAMSYVRSLPAHTRGQQGLIEAAYYMLRGQSVDSVWKTREAELIERYRRGEIPAAALQQPAGTFTAPPAQPGSVTLTQDQINAANAMGLRPEEYAAHIKLAAPQGGAR